MYNSEAKKLASEVREVALKSGANLVGIVPVSAIDAFPKTWVGWTIQQYTNKTKEIMPESESLIVVGNHVWDDMLELAIRKGERWVYPGYLPLLSSRRAVIYHLEKQGYKAALGRSRFSYKRLAQLAGLGNYGKNALIINPTFGPWIRLEAVLTNAILEPDEPFEEDLCGDCDDCVKACPVGALTPYKVDDARCLVGVHIAGVNFQEYAEELERYEPSFTRNSHLMCIECQKACKYGKDKRL